MKPEFDTYIDDIGEPTTVKERVNNLFEQYKNLFAEEIEDIFIEEYIDKKGEKRYDGIHFFSKNIDYQISNFLFKDNLFILPIKNRIDIIKITEKIDYDFAKATNKSRLKIECSDSRGDLRGDFFATGNNCDHLTKIIKKYLFQNFFIE
jgi:hypothetical protein